MNSEQNSSKSSRRSESVKMRQEKLDDFSVNWRVLKITALALPIGALAAVSALALLRLISFFTNVFYFGRFPTVANSPANHHLGWFAVFVPVEERREQTLWLPYFGPGREVPAKLDS